MGRVVELGGMPVRDTTAGAIVRWLEARSPDAPQIAVGFANHHFIVACQGLRDAAAADPHGILLLNDGIGVALAARLFRRRRFAENLNGTDLLPRILRDVSRDLDVFLLGGTAEVVARAAALVAAMPRRRVVGALDGYGVWGREAEVVRAINAARPDLLLVGFGNPAQERWILAHRRELGVGAIFAVGALFDWMTGEKRRAPAWVRRLRLEWAYRLAIEPRRLAKRYTLDVLRFVLIAGRTRAP